MSHNTWAHRLVGVAVPLLARLGATPNQVTGARLASGLAAAGALASGVPAWMHAGAGLWIVSMLLDRADGALARLTGQTSARGQKLDLASDCLATSLLFVGLGLGVRDEGAALMGVAAGLSVGLIFLGVLGFWIYRVRTRRTRDQARIIDDAPKRIAPPKTPEATDNQEHHRP